MQQEAAKRLSKLKSAHDEEGMRSAPSMDSLRVRHCILLPGLVVSNARAVMFA